MKNKKRVLVGASLAFLCSGMLLSCGKNKQDPDSFREPVEEEITVKIPGMQGEEEILCVADLHIIVPSEEIDPEQREMVEERREGMPGDIIWPYLVEYLNANNPVCTLFAGDMVDFASESNTTALGEGLKQLQMPWMYVRADHDAEPFYLAGVEKEQSVAYQNAIAPNEDVMVLERPDYMIVGWNNSTSQLTEAGLIRMKEVFALGKPIILLTHVPIASLVDESLEVQSKEVWGGRNLVWGPGQYYQPDDLTAELLNMIYAPDTPVREILCGHLHFSWDGYVTEQVHQHVFDPAFLGKTGVIHVVGE